jgi:hypothetical protein
MPQRAAGGNKRVARVSPFTVLRTSSRLELQPEDRRETHMSNVLAIRRVPVTISPDLVAVVLFSLLGFAITAAVFPMLAAYDLQSLPALPG